MSVLSEEQTSCAGIVLCGGKSRRMGHAKASLPFGKETLLQRITTRITPVCHPIIVVAAVGQEVPLLPHDVILVRDTWPGVGPLGGIAAGLTELAGTSVEVAFVTACDAPFLEPRLIPFFLDIFLRPDATHGEKVDVVVPRDGHFYHPLCALYRVSLREQVEYLLNTGMRRPVQLFEQANTCEVDVTVIEHIDPGLWSLMNLNHPEDYRDALLRAGMPLPDWLGEATK